MPVKNLGGQIQPNLRPAFDVGPQAGQPIQLQADDLEHLPPALSDIVQGTNYRYSPHGSARVNPTMRNAPNSEVVATTDDYSPRTVNVVDPALFRANEAAAVAHEATHEWQQQLPPSEQAAIPPDNTSSVAAMYSTANADKLRRQGKTLKDLPREEAAALVQDYVEHPQARGHLQPWIDDVENTKLSSLMPTMPDDPSKQPETIGGQLWQRLKGLVAPQQINTTSRAPGPPPSYALHPAGLHNPPPASNAPNMAAMLKSLLGVTNGRN